MVGSPVPDLGIPAPEQGLYLFQDPHHPVLLPDLYRGELLFPYLYRHPPVTEPKKIRPVRLVADLRCCDHRGAAGATGGIYE